MPEDICCSEVFTVFIHTRSGHHSVVECYIRRLQPLEFVTVQGRGHTRGHSNTPLNPHARTPKDSYTSNMYLRSLGLYLSIRSLFFIANSSAQAEGDHTEPGTETYNTHEL